MSKGPKAAHMDQPHLPPPHAATISYPGYQRNQYHQPAPTRTNNFCYDQQKNKPQSNSVGGALMVMLVSGVHIGWGIAVPQLRQQEWHLNTYPHEYTMVVLSWYLGAVLGSILTLFIYTKFAKTQIYYMAGGLCAISSALFIALPSNAAALIIVRVLAGIAHGFAYITGICHASENCVKEYRGTIISCFHYMILVSAYTVSIMIPAESDLGGESINFNLILGIMCLLYAVLGVALVPCFTFESIVYLIQRQQYREAINNMIKLRNETQETWDIKNDFDEMKLMVAEDLRTKPSIFKDGNTRPFILIILTKFVVALGFNYAINMIRVAAVAPVTTELWAPMTVYTIRFCVATVFIFMTDFVGRKKLFTTSTVGSGICMILFGILYLTLDNDMGHSVPIFIFEVLCAVGMFNIPDILMSEAFPITKKIVSMVIAAITEYALQIMIIGITYQMTLDSFLVPVVFTFGALLIFIGVFLHMNLPETRVMSLRQARSEFRKKYDEVTYNRESLPQHINNYS